MPGRRIGTHTTTRPFRCERCHHLGLTPTIVVGPGIIESRLLNGRYRDHAHANCSNGHAWWSVHPDAIRQASQANLLAALALSTTEESTSTGR
jgi:hypothetical protein